MLLRLQVLQQIADGQVTLVFRRWRKPTVKAGGRLRTRIGELSIDTVDVVSPARITAKEARAAGFASRAALLAWLESVPEGDVYRICVHLKGPDTRVALREEGELSDADVDVLKKKLARLDAASRQGPWTMQILRMIAEQPGVAARDLAQSMGVARAWFKPNVRKLKELGLTVSLRPGYRLSPRGLAFLVRC